MPERSKLLKCLFCNSAFETKKLCEDHEMQEHEADKIQLMASKFLLGQFITVTDDKGREFKELNVTKIGQITVVKTVLVKSEQKDDEKTIFLTIKVNPIALAQRLLLPSDNKPEMEEITFTLKVSQFEFLNFHFVGKSFIRTDSLQGNRTKRFFARLLSDQLKRELRDHFFDLQNYTKAKFEMLQKQLKI